MSTSVLMINKDGYTSDVVKKTAIAMLSTLDQYVNTYEPPFTVIKSPESNSKKALVDFLKGDIRNKAIVTYKDEESVIKKGKMIILSSDEIALLKLAMYEKKSNLYSGDVLDKYDSSYDVIQGIFKDKFGLSDEGMSAFYDSYGEWYRNKYLPMRENLKNDDNNDNEEDLDEEKLTEESFKYLANLS